jgi:carboxymethylenebutenolidase
MASENIKLASVDGGSFDAYIAHAPHGPAPGIVVFPSAYGANDGLLATVDSFAARGFVVIAPDVFWRTIPGGLPHEPASREKVMQRFKEFDVARGIDDIGTAMAYLKSLPECNGKVAVLGFCMGGRYAFLSLTRLGADAAAAFHGNDIEKHLDEASKLRDPKMSFHFGEEDPQIPMDTVKLVKGGLEGFPGVMIYTYPGCKHGFAQSNAPAYDAAAAELAYRRAFEMLDGLKTPVTA